MGEWPGCTDDDHKEDIILPWIWICIFPGAGSLCSGPIGGKTVIPSCMDKTVGKARSNIFSSAGERGKSFFFKKKGGGGGFCPIIENIFRRRHRTGGKDFSESDRTSEQKREESRHLLIPREKVPGSLTHSWLSGFVPLKLRKKNPKMKKNGVKKGPGKKRTGNLSLLVGGGMMDVSFLADLMATS